MLTMAEACLRVGRGAAWLDKVQPGWADRINVGVLNLGDTRACVLGQLFDDPEAMCCGYCRALAVYPEMDADDALVIDCGFDIADDESMFEAMLLHDAWVDAIASRLAVEHMASFDAAFGEVDRATA